MQADLDRFVALVVRELSARQARVLEAGEAAPGDPGRELSCALPDGRTLLVVFDAPFDDRELKQRRLEMLASTLGAAVDGVPPKRSSRAPATQLLRDELKALCARAGAANALVIDAKSPVIWGAAHVQGLGEEWPVVGREVHEPRQADEPALAEEVDVASRAALEVVRGLQNLPTLRKGKHLRHVEREGKGPLVAHSFAGIYLLVVVYASPFDELRAERAIAESLPRVEQLVLALPPLDPSPSAGQAALRRYGPRRR